VPPVVPDERGWAEPEGPAPVPQAPAQVDVVAGGAEARIPPVDRLERVSAKRAVATGNVLGLAVGREDVDGPTRGVRDAVGDRAVARRRDVRSPDPDVIGREEGVRQIAEPVRVGTSVVIAVRDDLARGGGKPPVPGAAE